jgi:hypothetical protein
VLPLPITFGDNNSSFTRQFGGAKQTFTKVP